MLNPTIYISAFRDVKDNGTKGFYLNETIHWSELVELLDEYRQFRFTHKEDAPLFAPTVFTTKRTLTDATMSGMACIDTDHCDLTYDDQVQMWQAAGFECVIYTTAHNTHGDRYRVVVPFSEPVDPATHDKAVRAICRTMSPKWSHDAGKSTCYSLFYFPGIYADYYLTKKTDQDGNAVLDKITGEPKWEARSPDAEPTDDDIHCKVQNHFTHLKGHIASAEEWIEIAPPEPIVETRTQEDYPDVSYDGDIPTIFARQLGCGHSGDWQRIRCKVCGDGHTGKKTRGNFLLVGEGFRYQCYNEGCEFYDSPTGWEPGRALGGRELQLFEAFGGCREDLPKIVPQTPAHHANWTMPNNLAEFIAELEAEPEYVDPDTLNPSAHAFLKPALEDRPIVEITADRIDRIVDEVERHLIDSRFPIYQFAGMLVTWGYEDIPDSDIRRPVLVPVTVNNLIEYFTAIIAFKRFDKRVKAEDAAPDAPKGDWVPTDCPKQIAQTYLDRAKKWRVSAIRQITHIPTLRQDGTLVDQPGYDPKSQIYYDPLGVQFAKIKPKPTRDDARAALNTITRVYREFPFVSDTDRAVFLSAYLTTAARTMFPWAPLHGFTAPEAGSGKSKLVGSIGIVFTGAAPSVNTPGHSEEEFEKRLGATLLEGETFISFDNCVQPLDGILLCQALSEPVVAIRPLGQSRKVKVPNTASYFATGNHLTLTGDLTRRAIICHLNAKCERPELRTFETEDPIPYSKRHRPELVIAALTVIQAFIAAGRPQPIQPLGGFEEWSQLI